MFKFGLIVLLASFASAQKLHIVNKETDEALVAVNSLLTKKGLGIFHFEAMADEKIQMGPGIQIGLNTLERRDTCTLNEFGNGTLYYDFHLGFRLFVLGYGEFTLYGETMAGVFKVDRNSIHVSYWLTRTDNDCNVELDHYDIPLLDEAVLFSSHPKFNNMDVSQLFREYGRARINQNMISQRPAIEQAIKEYVCGKDEGPITALHNLL